MMRDACAVIAGYCAALDAGDLEMARTFLTDDVVYAMNVDRNLVPFAGVSIGKAAMMRRLALLGDKLDVLGYQPWRISPSSDQVRATIAFHFRDRRTSEDIEGRLQIVGEFRDGLICRLGEHHDRPRVEAFFRLIAIDVGA